MLVICKKSFRHQTTENNTYLVIEILINRIKKTISYRIIDNEGYPAIYDAEAFDIISNKIDGFSIVQNKNEIVLSHKLIVDSDINKRGSEGFWGLFVEGDYDAKRILEDVVKILSDIENVAQPFLE